jgi:hypothetical protein
MDCIICICMAARRLEYCARHGLRAVDNAVMPVLLGSTTHEMYGKNKSLPYESILKPRSSNISSVLYLGQFLP